MRKIIESLLDILDDIIYFILYPLMLLNEFCKKHKWAEILIPAIVSAITSVIVMLNICK